MEGETGGGEAREGYMCKSRCLGAAAAVHLPQVP